MYSSLIASFTNRAVTYLQDSSSVWGDNPLTCVLSFPHNTMKLNIYKKDPASISELHVYFNISPAHPQN